MADSKWPLRINITEQDFWAPYDYASDPGHGKSGISEWSSDSAWNDFRYLETSSRKEYLQDLIDAFLTKREAQKIADEDLDYLVEHLSELENSQMAMIDAFTWAWEEAYTPTDRDMEFALEFAGDKVEVPNAWVHLLSEKKVGPKDWSPLPSFSENDLFQELESGISYEREKNHWDRFLVFDWKNGPAIKRIRRKLSEVPEEFSAKDFEADLENVAKDFVHAFGKKLDKEFQDVDISARVRVDPHWKSILKDTERKRGVQKEILAAVAAHRAEEAENAE